MVRDLSGREAWYATSPFAHMLPDHDIKVTHTINLGGMVRDLSEKGGMLRDLSLNMHASLPCAGITQRLTSGHEPGGMVHDPSRGRHGA